MPSELPSLWVRSTRDSDRRTVRIRKSTSSLLRRGNGRGRDPQKSSGLTLLPRDHENTRYHSRYVLSSFVRPRRKITRVPTVAPSPLTPPSPLTEEGRLSTYSVYFQTGSLTTQIRDFDYRIVIGELGMSGSQLGFPPKHLVRGYSLSTMRCEN